MCLAGGWFTLIIALAVFSLSYIWYWGGKQRVNASRTLGLQDLLAMAGTPVSSSAGWESQETITAVVAHPRTFHADKGTPLASNSTPLKGGLGHGHGHHASMAAKVARLPLIEEDSMVRGAAGGSVHVLLTADGGGGKEVAARVPGVAVYIWCVAWQERRHACTCVSCPNLP